MSEKSSKKFVILLIESRLSQCCCTNWMLDVDVDGRTIKNLFWLSKDIIIYKIMLVILWWYV